MNTQKAASPLPLYRDASRPAYLYASSFRDDDGSTQLLVHRSTSLVETDPAYVNVCEYIERYEFTCEFRRVMRDRFMAGLQIEATVWRSAA
ncbi:hypothetical protein CYL16_03290 [Mycobacterium sp. EPG1]|nr:hypothetical protein CYL16_03290 [Mycobacterium sp. EPG1]